jgi:protein involved in polysaccharide export with SLBB domain
MSSKKRLLNIVVLFVFVIICVSSGFAQMNPMLSSQVSGSTATGQTVPPPAAGVDLDRIKGIVAANPSLIDTVRQIVMKYARAHGDFVQPEQLTPQEMERRIKASPELQVQVHDELKSEGYQVDSYATTSSGNTTTQSNAPTGPGFGNPWQTNGQPGTTWQAGNAPGNGTQSNGPGTNPAGNGMPQPSPGANPWGNGTQPISAGASGGANVFGAGSNQPPGPEQQPAPYTLQVPVPYQNIPALKDLYTQIPAPDAPIERFGLSVFRNGSGNVDTLPSDLPAGLDYVVGAGDELNITLTGDINQQLTEQIDREGRIALPEVGRVEATGRSLQQLQQFIAASLRQQVHRVNVDVSINRVRSLRVYVVGDVLRPGPYDVSSLSTCINAIYQAQGPTVRGSLRIAQHYRGSQLVGNIDLYDLILHGVRNHIDSLAPGDTILVPPVGAQVTVDGMVRRPAIYELNGEKTLAEVIDLAGGVMVSGSLRQITLERVIPHQERQTLRLELPAANDGDKVENALRQVKVQDGDKVVVSPILPYNRQTVYLDGHVFRPGKFGYFKGMKVSDLITSYNDIMPEPAKTAEIVRLEPPLYRPRVLLFDLESRLAGNGEDPALQPFDTVRVYGRYEVDPPTVKIVGEVLRPGEYPLSEGMTASELVRMAGGFKRSAFTEEADLSTYTAGDGKKTYPKLSTVDLRAAMGGNAAADAPLKIGDTLTIRKLPGWDELGETVTVTGQVNYTGTYGVVPGEHLSELINHAGGFRSEAFPEGAVLERREVRQLAEAARRNLIMRVQQSDIQASPGDSATDQQQVILAFQKQKQQSLEALNNMPVIGRQVVSITRDVSKWAGTPEDIEIRGGDTIYIPKRPNYVLVQGQVYNATALTFRPGKTVQSYLEQAGGVTQMANKKRIFVIRANGAVLGKSEHLMFHESVLSQRLGPGDTIVVPEKAVSNRSSWKTLVDSVQVISGIAIAARVASSF